jgi:hypothetical protein
MSNIEQRADSRNGILSRYRSALRTCAVIDGVAPAPVRIGSIMPQSQLLSAIISLAAIERPACPKCQAQMMLARIVPAFSGTDLHTFECTLCNHVLKKLGACEDWRGPGRW